MSSELIGILSVGVALLGLGLGLAARLDDVDRRMGQWVERACRGRIFERATCRWRVVAAKLAWTIRSWIARTSTLEQPGGRPHSSSLSTRRISVLRAKPWHEAAIAAELLS